MKALWGFTILFLACGTAHSQSLRVLPVQIRGGQEIPAAIQFFCTENYNRKDCHNDIFTLRQALARYPLEKLGSWSFLLASSDEWQPLMTRLRLPSKSPAFTTLGGNTTVISQTLFSGPVDRRTELMMLYQVPSDQLLDLAVAHELAHALCHEFSELKATVYAEQLRTGHEPTCRLGERVRMTAGRESSIMPSAANPFLLAPARRPRGSGNPDQSFPPDDGTH